MQESLKTTQSNKLHSEYMELNEAKKETLRNDFLKKFDYASHDTFYKKINKQSPLWNYEREWFAERFNTTEADLFPEIEGQVGLG